jgi:thimet oligopeptidase
VRAYADQRPPLQGEDAKLLAETLRDYRRAGLALPPARRQEVERRRKELARIETDFSANINKAERAVTFRRAELEGVPETFLQQPGIKTGDDEYSIRVNVTWQFVTVMENARREATRRQLKAGRYRLATETNLPLLRQMLRLRGQIARQLGYASWADYQTELRMAGQARVARDFLLQLKTGLQPKFDAELAEFQRLKARDTGDPRAVVEHWDWRYYSNQLLRERHAIDTEQLRVFFAYEPVRRGLFDVYSRVFGLRIEQVPAPYLWSDDVTLHVVSDAQTGTPLGALYLDMFPREGKFNHFAQFNLVPGKQLARGRYQRPTTALVCNFPRPGAETPSLLSYNDVQTLFHEFGHALHSLLTQARYGRFAGTRVPRDFVEVPSSVFEYFARDKAVLERFAADYRDPSRRIPPALLDQLQAARLATIGTYYRRQLTFGLLDLALHDPPQDQAEPDPVAAANALFKEVFLPAPEDTTFAAYFGHLVGYDGGYYGYAWADAIAADVATVFQRAPGAFLDPEVGHRLREEILAPGGSREVDVSLRAFLGRDRSLQPFLESIGIPSR